MQAKVGPFYMPAIKTKSYLAHLVDGHPWYQLVWSAVSCLFLLFVCVIWWNHNLPFDISGWKAAILFTSLLSVLKEVSQCTVIVS